MFLYSNFILFFSLVVCNLYPFAETIAKQQTPNVDQAIEQIDIGENNPFYILFLYYISVRCAAVHSLVTFTCPWNIGCTWRVFWKNLD